MPVLRRNIFANYAGHAWMAAMSLLFIPFYIRLLGMEAFGLVGFMLAMQMLALLLDLGMGSVLNRELARRSHDAVARASRADLVRTFEWLLWPVTALLALAFWLAAGPLAVHWLHAGSLGVEQTREAVAVMGIAVALNLPCSFYGSGLSGLERQPRLNAINAACATLRNAGVVPVLVWVSPTIATFMAWFALVGALQALLLAASLWRLLAGTASRPRFRVAELRGAGRFAGGMMVISAIAIALAQVDRLVLSATWPLAELGYFSLCNSIAAGLGRMIQPMFNAIYPRFSRLVAEREDERLRQLYHLATQSLCVVMATVATVLMFFAHDVVYLWTGDAVTAGKVVLPIVLLLAGTVCYGLMYMPHALQFAHGWTRLAVLSHVVALVLGIPFSFWAVGHYGFVGASLLWLLYNLGFVIVSVPLMHRRLLPGEMGTWYLRDVLPPFLAAVAATALARWLLPALPRSVTGLLLLVAVMAVALVAAVLAAPRVRDWLRERVAALPRR